MKNDLSGLNRTKSDLVEQGLYKKLGQRGDSTYQMYGVFTYKGKTYFDRWNDTGIQGESQRYTLTVYESRGGETRKRCQLKEVDR
jgi:acyl-CoA-binding protein